MPAALLAASLHAAVRAYAPLAERNAGEVLAKVNRLLYETTSSERLITVFYGVYDSRDRTLTWANAGHCPPVVMQNSSTSWLETLTPPAGVLPVIEPVQKSIELASGDQLVMVSDGILEACNSAGEDFGESRLLQLLRTTGNVASGGLCSMVLDKTKEFAEGCPQADDLTIVTRIASSRSASVVSLFPRSHPASPIAKRKVNDRTEKADGETQNEYCCTIHEDLTLPL